MQAKETAMAKIHHLFVIDPIEHLNIQLDSSLRMVRALRNLGHETAICTPNQIEWLSSEGCAAALTQDIRFEDQDLGSVRLGPKVRRRLDSWTAIHMRKDPPYDLDYIACTWYLDSAKTRGVQIFNDPTALRNLNEKLSIFRFPDAIRDGLVSAQVDSIMAFLDGPAQGDGILKPLTLFGGRGVLRLNRRTMSVAQIQSILTEETQHGTQHRLIQAFDSRVFQGEVRAFTVGGQPLSWCLKRPQGQNFLANTRSGATLEAYAPSAGDLAMVESIGKALDQEGVFLAGFDVIGGYVSEINITSPRLLQAPGDGRDYYQEIALRIESRLRAR